MDLSEELEKVKDEESFLSFARKLAQDEKAASTHPGGTDGEDRESASIASFLESAVAWAEDSEFGASQGLGAANPWRKFATFLYCGKVYE